MARIVIAGGGTAGHIEPGLAIARLWKKSHPVDEIIFCGTKFGLEETLIPEAGFQLFYIPKVVVPRKLSLSILTLPFHLIRAIAVAKSEISQSDLLIGFGGYVSAPAYIAAKIARVPIVIHEANARPGIANRLGSYFTPFLACTQSVEKGRFSSALITGLPLKRNIIESFHNSQKDWKASRERAKQRLGFEIDKKLIFVMGGSQGSVAINKVIAQSLDSLISENVSILHSVGKSNRLPDVKANYSPVPYVDYMNDAYLAADLVIARSGAVTCSEFRTLGRFALFIPLPIGNGEQFLNAQDLVQQGRAEVIDQKYFTPEYLVANLKRLMEKSSRAAIDGDEYELLATEKIVSLMEHAMATTS
jgi:UDP-N-acetylglucosamine--N-acetylmuramyl-(pentapeptide) pyrophosphoryl-undecaprenol N-acetylglucosamine transferase